MVFWIFLYSVRVSTLALLKAIVSVLVPRVSEKKSLNSAEPLMSKVSTLNVFEIRNLSVARYVIPRSPSQLGLSVSPVRLYWPRLRIFGVAAGGLGGKPVIRGFQFRPVKLSREE